MKPLTAAVIVFPGSNGDRDLFETFGRAGFAPTYHPANQPLPDNVAVAGLPGGFSYGDYWRAGMLASQAPAVLSIAGLVQRGGLALGVCNGFQILVENGLLPGALRYNSPPGFRHRWLRVKTTSVSKSPWLHGIAPGTELQMPMAHGEGNYFHPDGEAAIRGQIPLVYTQNPNGSLSDAAALLDSTGQVLGIMPHPERASDPLLGSADGLRLFTAAHSWLSNRGAV